MKPKNLLQLQAYNYIKEKILSGDFSPNTLYSETKLSKELGISRTPMREALQCLSQDGYITIVPSKGFQIRQLTQQDMLESIQVRCAIEGYCITVLTRELETKKAKELMNALGVQLDNMRKLANLAISDHKALEQFIDTDHKFHLLLVEYANNNEFNNLFQRLMYLIKLTSSTVLSKEGRIKGTLDEHEAIYSALENGDGGTAYKILIDHLVKPIELTTLHRKL